MEGILFVLSEGCSWRAIDREDVSWNSIYHYFRRWTGNGIWRTVLDKFGPKIKGTLRFLDSTHVKVHCDGANPAGGQETQAMSRTKGGLNTKIHAVVDNMGNPVSLILSCGSEADITKAPAMICEMTNCVIVADKAYDSNEFRSVIRMQDSTPCVPPRSNRKNPEIFSKANYRKRHRVENFFQRIKRFRRIATRYDKLGETYFGFVCLAVFITLL